MGDNEFEVLSPAMFSVLLDANMWGEVPVWSSERAADLVWLIDNGYLADHMTELGRQCLRLTEKGKSVLGDLAKRAGSR